MGSAAAAVTARWEDVEQDRVSAHFEWVLALLRAQDVRDWSADRRERRAFTLDALEVYARRGQFPRNPLKHRMAPAFVDHRGTECAVASLMLAHGLASTVEWVRATMNLAYVADMGEAVDDFAETSGLTREELALVQPQYCPEVNDPCGYWVTDCGAGGPETCFCTYVTQPRGTSCELDGDPCTVEACVGRDCVAEGPLDCSDGDPGTHDACMGGDCFSVPILEPEPEGREATAEAAAPPDEGCAFARGGFDRGSMAPVLAALVLLALHRRRHRP